MIPQLLPRLEARHLSDRLADETKQRRFGPAGGAGREMPLHSLLLRRIQFPID
jgi:hypothetical protein